MAIRQQNAAYPIQVRSNDCVPGCLYQFHHSV